MRDKLGRFMKGHKPVAGFQKGHHPANEFKKGHHPANEIKKGEHRSPTTEFKKGDNLGKNNCHWRNGEFKDGYGYMFKYSPNHPRNISKYVRRSHLVMEKILGRYLNPEEIVHHINGIKDDDSPENLKLFATTNEHSRFHSKLRFPKGSIFGANLK